MRTPAKLRSAPIALPLPAAAGGGKGGGGAPAGSAPRPPPPLPWTPMASVRPSPGPPRSGADVPLSGPCPGHCSFPSEPAQSPHVSVVPNASYVVCSTTSLVAWSITKLEEQLRSRVPPLVPGRKALLANDHYGFQRTDAWPSICFSPWAGLPQIAYSALLQR